MSTGTEVTPNSRERLLEAASNLAYQDGVGIGVEALCKAAGVSKRSMYQLFESKDELLAASLERRTARPDERLVPPAEAQLPPRESILYVFEQVEKFALSPTYMGCPYLAVQIELKDTEHPASKVAAEAKRALEVFFQHQAELGGAADPEFLGRQLILIFDGASARAGIRADELRGLARATAAALLDVAGVR